MRNTSGLSALGDGEQGLPRNNLKECLQWFGAARGSDGIHLSGRDSGFIYSLPGQNPNAAGDSRIPPKSLQFNIAPLNSDALKSTSKVWEKLKRFQSGSSSQIPGITPFQIHSSKFSSPVNPNQNGGKEFLDSHENQTLNRFQPLPNRTANTNSTHSPELRVHSSAIDTHLDQGQIKHGFQSFQSPRFTQSFSQTRSDDFNPLHPTLDPISNRTNSGISDFQRRKDENIETSSLGVQRHENPQFNIEDSIDDEIMEAFETDELGIDKSATFSQPLVSPDNNEKNLKNIPEKETPFMCEHGIPIEKCDEVMVHVQKMKNELISISNELIDNAAELSAQHSEELRLKRKELNKLIKEIESRVGFSSSSSLNVLTSPSPSPFSPNYESFHRQNSIPLQTKFRQFDSMLPQNVPYNTPSFPVKVNQNYSSYESTENENQNSYHANSTSQTTSFTHSIANQRASSQFNTNLYPNAAPDLYPNSNHQTHTSNQFVGRTVCIDGSLDKRWSKNNFPWTRDLEENNRKLFGNRSFRSNQREIMNASMSGYDVIVLMPTGGGKSLTYQLPAVCVPGVTLVISPLLSLIVDQIMHLEQANIRAAYLSANLDWNEQQKIYSEFNSSCCQIKLLYVTPEKIAKSDNLLRHLESLHRRDLLTRIVIDEVHCISHWGHDFRPDYQALGILKQRFASVPIMGLTATATPRVKEDVVQALSLSKCIIFQQTFNRPNIWYEVRPKTKKCIEEIDEYIKKNYHHQSGIIYCLSRYDCEKMAEKLQELGHRCAFYHANMDSEMRVEMQRKWSKDEIDIICATVAFGMGINKPDVRFIIHHSLPKSIEAYHQETGRAGRDSQFSRCILFYNYSDYIRVKHMLLQAFNETNNEKARTQTELNLENLIRMVSYCENDIDCRRTLQLCHFGEKFESTRCQKTCDNCHKELSSVEKNVSDDAKKLIQIIRSTGQKQTLQNILDIFRGALTAHIKRYGHFNTIFYGDGKSYSKSEVERILHKLVFDNIIFEDVTKSDAYGSISSVLKINESKARLLEQNAIQLLLRFPTSNKKSQKKGSENNGISSHTPPLVQKSKGKSTKPSDYSHDINSNIYGSSPSLSVERKAMSGKSKEIEEEIERVEEEENPLVKELGAELFKELQRLRVQLVKESQRPLAPYHIFSNAVLQTICKKFPKSMEELLEIPGIGKVKANRYGARVIELVNKICDGNQTIGHSTQETQTQYVPIHPMEPESNNDWKTTNSERNLGRFSSDNEDVQEVLLFPSNQTWEDGKRKEETGKVKGDEEKKGKGLVEEIEDGVGEKSRKREREIEKGEQKQSVFAEFIHTSPAKKR